MADDYKKESDGGYSTPASKIRRFRRKKKVCEFCVSKLPVDYKDVPRLRRYMTERGKILPRRTSGACSKCQRKLSIAIKRARELALLPYVAA